MKVGALQAGGESQEGGALRDQGGDRSGMDGNVGMTRKTLEILIGRMLDAETRDIPPPAGEEADWFYGSAGFTAPDEHGLDGVAPFRTRLWPAGVDFLANGDVDRARASAWTYRSVGTADALAYSSGDPKVQVVENLLREFSDMIGFGYVLEGYHILACRIHTPELGCFASGRTAGGST